MPQGYSTVLLEELEVKVKVKVKDGHTYSSQCGRKALITAGEYRTKNRQLSFIKNSEVVIFTTDK